MSVFEKYKAKAYPFQFTAEIVVSRIAGGTPTDPKVAEGWLRKKLAVDEDDLIRQMVAETMADRGIGKDEATQIVTTNKHLNGFKRGPHGLYIEGRQVKAALKEAASVAVNAGKLSPKGWGTTNKGLINWFPEHVFVQEDVIPLGVTEPTGVAQRFVHTWRGSGIQYEEYVDDAKLSFTVVSDHEFSAEQWALLWLTGEQQGVGASRSQGYGRYEVTRWDRLT